MSRFSIAEDGAASVLDLTTPGGSSELAEIEGRLHVLRGLLDAHSRLKEVNETVQFAADRYTALAALQQEPLGFSHQQAEAILDMPVSWQTSDQAGRLRRERDALCARHASLRQHVAEVFALHWFG